MTPQITEHPGMTLAGFSVHTGLAGSANLRDIPAFWQHYSQHHRAALLAALGTQTAPEYGVVCRFDPHTGSFDYLVGMEWPEGHPLPEGAERYILAPATYAVFSTPPVATDADFRAGIVDTWQAIYRDWLPASAWQAAPREVFERYDGRCLPGRPDRQIDIYQPVIPR